MKLWKQPAQLLPVRVRPVHGETVFSYVFRLAEANDLDRPTILLRALGEPTTGPSRFMVDEFDLMLNQHALHRLGTLSGIAADQLLWSLPSLHRLLPSGPDGPPVIRRYRCHSLRKHCETCLSRMPGRPKIIIRPMAFPKICAKHRRWIDTRDKEDQFQIDLAGAPEVITAHRRYARLRHKVGVGEQAWLREQLRAVTLIAREWVWKIRWDREELHQRWEARSAAIRHGRARSRRTTCSSSPKPSPSPRSSATSNGAGTSQWPSTTSISSPSTTASRHDSDSRRNSPPSPAAQAQIRCAPGSSGTGPRTSKSGPSTGTRPGATVTHHHFPKSATLSERK
jgi:hypothetical protein